jgi:class 3 adenylate cyclase
MDPPTTTSNDEGRRVIELPSGTVTLLFTDIEGSTRLIEELGEDGYVLALAEHRRLLRSAFSAHGGVEVDTQGDAFLYAFADPVGALAAAAQGQQALASGHVKVRMGMHTGTVRVTSEGYAGRELHRAPGSPPRATEARWFSPRPRGRSSTATSSNSASTG